MSGVYLRCRGCQAYRPRREFTVDHNGHCRCCDPPITEKWCRSCDQTKPIDEFHIDRNSQDGRRTDCKLCRNLQFQRWHAQRQKAKARQAERGPARDPLQDFLMRRWA